jgi:polar amino acid transport system substrate-binding protein
MNRFLPLLPIFAVLLWSGCGRTDSNKHNLAMLEGGKKFAVPTGTVADQFVLRRFPDAKVVYYNSTLDCVLAVKNGKADAGVYDLPVLKNIVARNEGLEVLPELIEGDRYGFGMQLQSTDLKKTVDGVLVELQANGTYANMMKRWFPDKGSPAPMPKFDFAGASEAFRFGTAAVTEPMAFIDADRNVVGFDIELAAYVAKKLGKRLEVVDMEFGAMIPALIAGKVDMIGAGLSITAERAKKILYSESYYPSGIAVVVRASGKSSPTGAMAKMQSVEDIRDKRIGVLLGSVYDLYTAQNYPAAKILQYQNVSDLLIALNSDKVDVMFYDQAAVPDVLQKNPALGILAKDVFSIPIGAGFNQEDDPLREQFNAFLKAIRTNGVYVDMVKRWMDKGMMEMPALPGTPTNGVFRVGVVDDLGMPFGLIKDGKLIGFDIELSARFAAAIGREFVPVPLPFGSLIASIATRKIDMITASMFITEERKKQIDFSDPYCQSGVSLVARQDHMAPQHGVAGSAGTSTPEGKSFLARVADGFYNNIILENRYLLILNGLRLTILISIFAALLGTVLGGIVCYLRMSKRRVFSATAAGYIWLLRGTPVLVLLMIIYYIVFASVNINPTVVAVFAFGLNFGAYVSEMFRTAIESIDKGQREAGIAGGFTTVQTFIYIILPQALRHLLPVYKGEFISLVKMTSIVGYIAVQDLTKASDIIRSRTFDAFFPLIMAAGLYLVIAWLLTRVLDAIEISSDPQRRVIKQQLEATR